MSPEPAASRAPLTSPIRHGPRDRKRVALTFDADMTPEMLAATRSKRQRSWFDSRIVDALRATATLATVFLTGMWAQAYREEVRALAADPLFELENHSFDHAAWSSSFYGLPWVRSEAARRREVMKAAAVIERLAGRAPAYFRFPGGCASASDVALVQSLGETPLEWDVVSGDALQSDPSVVVGNVLRRVRRGSIVVMHFIGAPNAPATADALKRILPALKERGFTFVTLSELLADR